MAKLSDIFTLQMGKTPARAKREYWNNGDNDWVSISDLSTYGKYVGDTKETISDLAVKDSGIKPVPADTVIMSFKLTLGKTAITVKPTYTNEAIMAFISKGNYPICPSYFYHFFGGCDWSKGTNRAVMGVTLNKATLGEIDVVTPPLKEQERIAEHLDRVDELISYHKEQLLKFDELVKSRFIELFEKEEYKKVTVSSVLNTGFWLMPATPEFMVDGEVPYITSKNIKNRTIDFDNVKYISREAYKSISANRPTQKGDILISMIGTLGQTAVIQDDREFYGQNLYLLRLNNAIVNTTYFCEFFNSDTAQYKLQGKRNQSTQAYLKANHVEDLILPLPPMKLQEQFAAFVEQADKSKLAVQQSLEKLETLKKALMQKYFG